MDFWAVLAVQRKAYCDELRERGPVAVGEDGVCHLIRGAEVVEALRSPQVFSSAVRSGVAGYEVVDLPLIQAMDPPGHDRYREALRRLLNPQAVKDHLSQAAALAGALIDRVASDGECDVMSLVRQYGLEVVQLFCGLAPEDSAGVFSCKHAAMFGAKGTAEHLAAVFVLLGYVAAAVNERCRNPGSPGLLGQLAAALGDAAAISIGYSLLGGAGNNENIVLGSAFAALACNRPWRRLLCADPGQTKLFIDEVLRLEPPSPVMPRVAACDVTIAGVTIPAGAQVDIHLGVVNRDGSDEITTADGGFTRHRHWSFGAGPHRCPGAHLARAELAVLINEWLRRIPEFEIADTPTLPPQGVELPSLRLRW